ncbi:MAG TPA: hypothetical protein VL854_03875, partial [Nitrososphaeraceae archaeon]|nr:hypothetical protein [Nitrososphaeraceae archaeon]
MAFFDVGINVNVNIGQSVANVNSLIASMQRLQTMGNIGTQAAAGLNTLNQNLVQTGNTATQTGQKIAQMQNNLNTFASGGANANTVLSSLRTNMASTATSADALGNAASQLKTQFSSTVAPINQGGNALRQFSGQLQQTGTAMNNTATSGNRLAEIFRGNRGLVFGASAFFGTLTGIAFELQLVNDANGQVADSQGKLNQLMAEGKQGSAQYSQAQQA